MLYEYRPDLVRMSYPKLVKKEDLLELDGFMSIWGYPDDTAEYIRNTGNLKGLKGRPLYMDCLYLDFDNNDAAYEQAISTLNDLGLSYEAYTTGNRGQHIHIDCVPIISYSLPARVINWVTSLFPGADKSIYKPSGIIRIPGTRHGKTLKLKSLLVKKPGTLLDLPEVLPYGNSSYVYHQNDADATDKDFMKVHKVIAEYPQEGGRNNHCFRVVASIFECGFDYDTAEQVVSRWNRSLDNPMGWQEVEAVLRSVYGGKRANIHV
jgi:hypothetical protein